jgi:ubiquinone/menaquinone biosynthesis C-methylase UbiE
MTNSASDLKVAQHFDSIAETYADSYTNNSFFSYFFDRRLQIVFDFLENCNRATVLDVGCGAGMMAKYSIERNFEFFGVDISEKMIETCIDRFGHLSSTHFSVGKLQNLEFPDAFFDVVLCMGALEYVERDEIDRAVSEMSRVLKPDGLLVMSLMNEKSFFTWNRKIKNSIFKKLFGRDRSGESYDGLSKAFDENYVRNLLNSNQLTEIEIVFFGLNILPSFLENKLPNLLKIMLSKGLENLFKNRFSWSYMAFIVKAKKERFASINHEQ